MNLDRPALNFAQNFPKLSATFRFKMKNLYFGHLCSHREVSLVSHRDISRVHGASKGGAFVAAIIGVCTSGCSVGLCCAIHAFILILFAVSGGHVV